MKLEQFVKNEAVKRAVEVALAGDHTIMFVGGPLTQAKDFAEYMKWEGSKNALAVSPCPCGWFGNSSHACRCQTNQLKQYQWKQFNPAVLSFYDLIVEVQHDSPDGIMGMLTREKVYPEDFHMKERIKAMLPTHEVSPTLNRECLNLLKAAIMQMYLNYHIVLRMQNVAHTIARLAQQKEIHVAHLAEAIQYRPFNWMKDI